MIKKMTKVQIIGPKGYLDECIKVLHSAAVVHIETHPSAESEEFISRLPIEKEKLKEKELLDRSAERLKNLLLLLNPPKAYRTIKVGSEDVYRYLETLKPVEESVIKLSARKDSLSEELSTVSKYERLIRGVAPIVSRLGGLRNFDIVGLTIERTRENIPQLLEAEVAKITEGSYQVYQRDLDETTIGMVLTYPKKYAGQIRYLLSGRSINEIRLPDEYEEMPLLNALRLMQRKKEELPGRIQDVERELDWTSEQWYGTIAGAMRAVEDSVDEIGVINYASHTKFAFLIEGWVPADDFEPLRQRFENLFGDRILLRPIEVKEAEEDETPVYIRNPRLFRPFEVFLAALPPPKYGSVDPTPFVAIFFPIFFGLIVGDIGYGVLIFILSVFLRHRFKSQEMFKNIFTVLMISSISAIIFGIFFGELFGDLGTRLKIIHPLLLHREEALKTLLIITLIIGIGHVALGLLISVFSNLKRKRGREAAAKISYLLVVVSFLGILGIKFNYIASSFLIPDVAVFIISLITLTVLEGILGPIEFIEALGNILSYVRLMAIGTASVIMALVANRMGSMSESLVAAIIIAGLIHTLNLFLSILSPSIQSMRLHYVEFFSKFYEGGGRRYVPFRKR
ncbi:MAG: hypothetical protein HYS21_11175 [Deltaproteobacteria bacterium]|nr:hypothetical protein [Deltaproteobacteria bacterium]